MKKVVERKEYAIYDNDIICIDIICFSKKELKAYQEKNPTYFVEIIDVNGEI